MILRTDTSEDVQVWTMDVDKKGYPQIESSLRTGTGVSAQVSRLDIDRQGCPQVQLSKCQVQVYIGPGVDTWH